MLDGKLTNSDDGEEMGADCVQRDGSFRIKWTIQKATSVNESVGRQELHSSGGDLVVREELQPI